MTQSKDLLGQKSFKILEPLKIERRYYPIQMSSIMKFEITPRAMNSKIHDVLYPLLPLPHQKLQERQVTKEYSSNNQDPTNCRIIKSPTNPNSRITITSHDIRIYPPHKIYQTFTECRFLIQIQKNECTDAYWNSFLWKEKPIRALFVDPIGNVHKAMIKNCHRIRNYYYGFFYPIMAGVYKISVFVPHDTPHILFATNNVSSSSSLDHVKGSPFTVMISKNYQMETKAVSICMGEDGIAEDQSRNNPGQCWGLATDNKSGRIFLTNREQHDISIFNASGTLILKFGREQGAQSGDCTNLCGPTGIICDSFNHRLLVADKDNHRIAIYSLDGEFITSFGTYGKEDGQFAYPWDVDCTSNGDRIIVSDSKNCRIQLFDKFGNFLKKYNLIETCRSAFRCTDSLDPIRGVSFDREAKNIYVTDFVQESVIRINADFTEAEKLPVPSRTIRNLQGLTVDQVGNILVCDSKKNEVCVLKPDGTHVKTISKLENIPLIMPLNVAVMNGGNIAILDYNGRVRVF